MSAIDWQMKDLDAIAAILNSGERSYASIGVDFSGWHVLGRPFQAPGATVDPVAVFGRLSLGRSSMTRASGDHFGAPARTGQQVCMELFLAGQADLEVYTTIFDDAVGDFYLASTSTLWTDPGTWVPPRDTDQPSGKNTFPGFMPVRGDLGYWTGSR